MPPALREMWEVTQMGSVSLMFARAKSCLSHTSYGPFWIRSFNQMEQIARCYSAFTDYSVVPACEFSLHHLVRQISYACMCIQLPARLPPLTDLDYGGTERKDVSDAYNVLCESGCRNVLTEPARTEL